MLTVTQLNAMSVQDLLKLNKAVVAIVKEKQRMENRVASVGLMSGDRVSFNSTRYSAKMTGTVREVKRTKVLVDVTGRGQFLVPAAMLSKA